MTTEQRIREKSQWAAFVTVLLLLATPAVAASWADSFKTVDTDGSGTISRAEWDANASKVGDPTFNPTLQTMDTDHNNRVDPDEWAAAEKMKMATATTVRSPRLPGVRARTIRKSRSARSPISA